MQKKQQIVSVLEDSIKERKALSRVSGSGVEWGEGALLTGAWGRGGDFRSLLFLCPLGDGFVTTSCSVFQTFVRSSSGILSTRSNPLNLFVSSTV